MTGKPRNGLASAAIASAWLAVRMCLTMPRIPQSNGST